MEPMAEAKTTDLGAMVRAVRALVRDLVGAAKFDILASEALEEIRGSMVVVATGRVLGPASEITLTGPALLEYLQCLYLRIGRYLESAERHLFLQSIALHLSVSTDGLRELDPPWPTPGTGTWLRWFERTCGRFREATRGTLPMTPWKSRWQALLEEAGVDLGFELNQRGPPILLLGASPPDDLAPILWRLYRELINIARLSLAPEEAASIARVLAEREAENLDEKVRKRFEATFFGGTLSPVFQTGITTLDQLQPQGFVRGGIYQIDATQARYREAIVGAILAQLLGSGWASIIVFSTSLRETLQRDLSRRGHDLASLEHNGQLLWVDWMTHRVRRVTGVEEDGSTFYSGPDLTNLGIAMDRAHRVLSPLRPTIAILDVATTLFAVHDASNASDFLEGLKSRFRIQRVPALVLTDSSTMDRRARARLRQWASGCLEITRNSDARFIVTYLERGTRRQQVELAIDQIDEPTGTGPQAADPLAADDSE